MVGLGLAEDVEGGHELEENARWLDDGASGGLSAGRTSNNSAPFLKASRSMSVEE